MRFLTISFLILLLDQAVKQLVLRVLPLPIWLISDDVGLRLSFNPGIAFSLPVDGVWALALSTVVICFLLFFYFKYIKKSLGSDLIFGLILGGAVGNMIDRLLFGHVIDYITIYSYPNFNIADIAITAGFLLFILRFDRMTAKSLSLF